LIRHRVGHWVFGGGDQTALAVAMFLDTLRK
jgi:hypothetical protein